jgi:hypothetical protein
MVRAPKEAKRSKQDERRAEQIDDIHAILNEHGVEDKIVIQRIRAVLYGELYDEIEDEKDESDG